MTTKHIHCDVIKAWADGEIIQYYDTDLLSWRDVCGNWPSFDPSIMLRVKPKPVTKWYRVALYKWMDGRQSFGFVCNNAHQENISENHPYFVRWVTDRQYVEV